MSVDLDDLMSRTTHNNESRFDVKSLLFHFLLRVCDKPTTNNATLYMLVTSLKIKFNLI
jgi:hypothetical protein